MDLLRVTARVAAGGDDDFSKLFPPPAGLGGAEVERFDSLAKLRLRQKQLQREGWRAAPAEQELRDDADALKGLTVSLLKGGEAKVLSWP